jgi:SAM-dependent methyltransferase
MTLTASLQPDQQPTLWDSHAAAYERVFEPLTNAFARSAIARLALRPGDQLLDVAAGAGGAALIAAKADVQVLAIDGSEAMVKRIRERAANAGLAQRIHAEIMDGTALALPDASIDAAVSIFGVVLFPDAAAGMREIARVVKPGGRVAVVTWTEPEHYELVGRLMTAVSAAGVTLPPPPSPPAQLRFREEKEFRALLAAADLEAAEISRLEERLHLPSARWIAEHIEFAPGMAAMLKALGADRDRVLETFVATLEHDQGMGEIALSAVAFAGIGRRPT